MFAVLEIGGRQFEVQENDTVSAPLIDGEPGDTVELDKILLVKDGKDTKVGTPYLEGSVQAKIVEHTRADKVLVFKKKRRKGYQKLNGHRQDYTLLEITNIKLQ